MYYTIRNTNVIFSIYKYNVTDLEFNEQGINVLKDTSAAPTQ